MAIIGLDITEPKDMSELKKASGGVGILIKDSVLHQFKICNIDKSVDGILVICLQNKDTDFKITVICVYLPPESSTWGRNSDVFFIHLTSVLYASQESDIVLITGDFNARVGNMSDCINDLDDIPKREILDDVKNSHGDSLIDYLKDTQTCIVNGRISQPREVNLLWIISFYPMTVSNFVCHLRLKQSLTC